MRLVIAVVVLLAGCEFNVPPTNGEPCTASNGSCVCLMPQGVCVECTEADESNCGGTRPQCGDNNVCRACTANEDCDESGACLEDGSCADKNRVIYAAPIGVTTSGCGQMLGQNECSIEQALAEVSTTRDIIRLARGTYTMPTDADGLDFSGKSAILIARGATLVRPAPNGAILSVRNGESLTLIGGTIQGPNNTTDGIRCIDSKLFVHEAVIENLIQSGIETSSCELTVTRSKIRGNDDGGINMLGLAKAVTITNNFVYGNGQGTSSAVGGMRLNLVHPGSKVEFNTVVDNLADLGGSSAGGITCNGQGYDLAFNLVYRNTGGIGGTVQIIGTCTSNGSYQQPAVMPGENAVGFERPNDAANPSYRLTAASPPGTVRDAFDCNDIDFERDPRPSPSAAMMGKCDYGADEYRMGQ